MPTLNLLDVGFAHWKEWTVKHREANGPFTEDAKLLSRLLDQHYAQGRAAATNMRDGLRASIERIVGRMLLNGAELPKVPAVLR